MIAFEVQLFDLVGAMPQGAAHVVIHLARITVLERGERAACFGDQIGADREGFDLVKVQKFLQQGAETFRRNLYVWVETAPRLGK